MVTALDLNRWVVIIGIVVAYFVISMFMDEIPLLLAVSVAIGTFKEFYSSFAFILIKCSKSN